MCGGWGWGAGCGGGGWTTCWWWGFTSPQPPPPPAPPGLPAPPCDISEPGVELGAGEGCCMYPPVAGDPLEEPPPPGTKEKNIKQRKLTTILDYMLSG